MNIGLRFRRQDQAKLRKLAHEFRGLPGINERLFTAAADAARTGEPLIVECTRPQEVHEMAGLFAVLGVRQPIVEELSGHRPRT